MKSSTYSRPLVFLWVVLGVGVVVELVMSVWHGAWDVEPILPAVLSGGIYQTVATSAANPGERQRVPVVALILVAATSALAVVSAVMVWLGDDGSERTGAVVAGLAALFFLGGLVRLGVRARGTT